MLGQFLLCGVEGLELTAKEKEFLDEVQPVGIILFSRNYKNKIQLKALTRDIQSHSKGSPFLIGADQEGGRVQRFKDEFTRIPSMKEFALSESPKKVFEAHQLIAEELLECGVNLNFSPVCDILSNPNNDVIGDRSFSSDPVEVEKFTSAAIRGMLTKNLICCAKHFPGHGRSLKDSHLEKVIVSLSEDELNQEMIPFRKAIRSKVPMLMPSHMVVDYFDQNLPCSMSQASMSYIRKDLAFAGVIISDDFNMNAIKNEFAIEEASRIAIEAGCDIICYRDMSLARQSYDYLTKKKISEKRVIETKERLIKLKTQFLKDN